MYLYIPVCSSLKTFSGKCKSVQICTSEMHITTNFNVQSCAHLRNASYNKLPRNVQSCAYLRNAPPCTLLSGATQHITKECISQHSTHLWYVLQQTDPGYTSLHTPLVCLTANRSGIHLTAHTSGISYSKQTRNTSYCTHLWYVLQQTDQGYTLLHTPLRCLTANRPGIHLTAHTSGMSYSKQARDTPYCTHLWITKLQCSPSRNEPLCSQRESTLPHALKMSITA